MNIQPLVFYAFAGILVAAALLVVFSRNPVHSALWLVLSFFSAAGVWLLLEAEFLAIALVLVYVLHSVGCTFGWPADAIRLGLGLIILVHLALIGWLWRNYAGTDQDPALDRTASFLNWVILWTLIAAFVTIVFTLVPTLLLTTCT